jgi:hypothetical protein
VQSHGVDATGTVTYVRNHKSCGRSSCSYTAAMGIAFAGPVDGTTATTVHYRGTLALSAGESVLVLVDPHEPGYAELPGAPFKRTRDWVVMVILAVVSAAVAALEARALARGLAARRQGRVARWG